jgi:hypothetical protein
MYLYIYTTVDPSITKTLFNPVVTFEECYGYGLGFGIFISIPTGKKWVLSRYEGISEHFRMRSFQIPVEKCIIYIWSPH